MVNYQRFSRKPRRLQGYDYRNEGWNFIAICTKDRICYFGEIANDEMQLSDLGQIAYNYWLEIPNHSSYILLGEFIVMPNHVHGILGIDYRNNSVAPSDSDGATELNNPDPNKNIYMSRLSPKKNSISRVIGTYKAACTYMIRRITDIPFGWQPRFHDRIIRNQQEMLQIEYYIQENPLNWKDDANFSA